MGWEAPTFLIDDLGRAAGGRPEIVGQPGLYWVWHAKMAAHPAFRASPNKHFNRNLSTSTPNPRPSYIAVAAQYTLQYGG
jgi:hypothetical protein